MEIDKEEQSKELQNQNFNPNSNNNDSGNDYKEINQTKMLRRKLCAGCLYYSGALKSNSHDPICVGVTRTLNPGMRFDFGSVSIIDHLLSVILPL